MKSPQFRKQTGFIKRKVTQGDKSDQEEELSGYRDYKQPIYEAQKYIYQSLRRENLMREAGGVHIRHSPKRQRYEQQQYKDDSSSEFDKFEMNSDLSSDFRNQRIKGNVGKQESSFSLSPYEQSSQSDSNQKWKLQSKKAAVAYQFSKQRIPEKSFGSLNYQGFGRGSNQYQSQVVNYEMNKDMKKQKEVQQNLSSSSESSSEKVIKRQHQQYQSKGDMKHEKWQIPHSSQEKQPINFGTSPKYHDESSSSSFSLDSQDSPRLIQQYLTVHKSSCRNMIQPNNDKTATFTKLQEMTVRPQQLQQSIRQLSSSDDQELVTEYDTKQFKGGSMKERILNTRYIKQQQSKKLYEQNYYKQDAHFRVKKSSQSPPRENDKKSIHQTLIQQDTQYCYQKSRKPQRLSMDVKVNHMSLAEAFEIRCGRLKRKLQEERQQFKKGNYSKLYKQRQEENYAELANISRPILQKPINKNMERLALGIRPQINKHEMMRNTKNKYKQLPEVRHRIHQQRKKQDLAKRIQNVKKLDREIRLRMKYSAQR